MASNSIVLVWRDFAENLRPEGVDTIAALKKPGLAPGQLNEPARNGRVTTIMGVQTDYWETLVFLEKDVFLRIERSYGKTTATRYDRVSE